MRWLGARRSCRTRRSGGPSAARRRPSDARIMALMARAAARSRWRRGWSRRRRGRRSGGSQARRRRAINGGRSVKPPAWADRRTLTPPVRTRAVEFPAASSWCGRHERREFQRPDQEAGAARRLPRATIHAIMMGILLAMFLSALEQTIVAPALADHRAHARRRRGPVLGGDGVSAGQHRGDAAVRQAVRHPRPAADDARRHRHLRRWARSRARWRRPCRR